MNSKPSKLKRRLRVFKWRIKRGMWSYIGWTASALFALAIIFASFAAFLFDNAFKTLGEFGDFVGGISNPMLALLGLLALLYTIRLQSGELALSRRELALTRMELDRSASALEQQSAHLERQQLSQSFFDLFEVYKSVISEISVGTKEHKTEGKGALGRYYGYFSPNSWREPATWSLQDVQRAHEGYNSELGNYFRVIYRILSFLNDHGNGANLYADMFRAQLTTPELHLLFLNCCSEVGSPMQIFAVRFELFDNMPIPDGNGFETIVKRLDIKSFGKNQALIDLHNS